MTTPAGVLFQPPFAQILSATGVPQAGMYAQFFLTGTNTPANVYSDGACTVSLGNTVTANAAGQLPAFYTSASIVYKVSLYTAANVLITTQDPYVTPLVSTPASPTLTGLTVNGNTTITGDLAVSPTSGVGLTATAATGQEAALFNGAAGQPAVVIDGSSTSGQSYGLAITAGTTSADSAVNIQNNAGKTLLKIAGNGEMTVTAPTSGNTIDSTFDSGTGTVTGTGLSGTVTAPIHWFRIGNLVIVQLQTSLGGTSSSTSFGMNLPASGMPLPGSSYSASLDLTVSQFQGAEDAGSDCGFSISYSGGGASCAFFKVGGPAWTGSGTKAIFAGATFMYYTDT